MSGEVTQCYTVGTPPTLLRLKPMVKCNDICYIFQLFPMGKRILRAIWRYAVELVLIGDVPQTAACSL